MTEVGVATFSDTLKSSVRKENEQMSTPEPAMALKLPPTKPMAVSTTACHTPKFGMESYVLRLCCLFSRNRAKAKLNHTDTKINFFTSPGRAGSRYSRPIMDVSSNTYVVVKH